MNRAQHQLHAGDGLARTLADTPRRAIGETLPVACPCGPRCRVRDETNPGILSRESASDLGPRCTHAALCCASGSYPSPGTGRESPGTLSADAHRAGRPEAPQGASPLGRFLPGLVGAFGLRPLWGAALALAALLAGTAAPRARSVDPDTDRLDLCLFPKPVEVRLEWTIAGQLYAVSVCRVLEPAFDPRLALPRLRRPQILAEAR